jgi:formamidopyrimidine-DNA glycosylase
MPELSEVEFARKTLARIVEKHKISLKVVQDDIVFKCNPLDFDNSTISSTSRYGKYFWLSNDNGEHLCFHLGMTGCIRTRANENLTYESKIKYDENEWPPKFMKIMVRNTDTGEEAAFCDPRRLARVNLVDSDPRESLLKDLGFDPILCMPEYSEFKELLSKRKKVVKQLLLDQTFCAGLGNWMADEVLYHAKIHPQQHTTTFNEHMVKQLYESIIYVSETCVKLNADSALYPADWLFHDRWGKGKQKKPTYQGRLVKFIVLGGRTSAYLPLVQILQSAIEQDDHDEKQPTKRLRI